ncbi:MAG: MmgE/PrpD family protein [Candidatus Binatia bacterium]
MSGVASGGVNVTQRLAQYVVRTTFDDLPQEAVQATKEHLLHTLGTVLAGAGAAGILLILDLVREWGGCPESTVLVHNLRVPAPNASLVNSAMAHAHEMDENDDRIAYKSSVAVIPGALAVAESIGGMSGKAFITAVCLGVDLGIRIGLAANPKPTHAHAPTLGPLAAAAAAAKLLGLDERGVFNALGIAYCRVAWSASATASPSLAKRLSAGLAAQGGVFAARLASKGFPAGGDVLRGRTGFFQTFRRQEGDVETLLSGLGERFEIVYVGPKPYPSCRYTHPAIDATLSILTDHPFAPEEVEEIKVWMGQRDMESVGGVTPEQRRKKQRPEGVVDAQFSIPYTVALTLVKGRPTPKDFSGEAIRESRVLEIAHRVNPQLDLELERWPLDVKPQVVEIKAKGEIFQKRVEYPKGNPRNPVPHNELRGMFRELASYSPKPISEQRLDEVLNLLDHLEEVEDVGALVQALT